jgi:hypothetical protein
MTSDPMTGYVTILRDRQAAHRRNLIIAGGLFLLAVLATIGFGLLSNWNGWYIYGMLAIVILELINFLMTWVRREITKENIELIQYLAGKA